MSRRKTQEEFENEVRKVWGDTYDLSEAKYISNKKKVILICKKHGRFKKIPNNLLTTVRTGCPKCGHERRCLPRVSAETIIRRFKNTHKDRYDYSLVKDTFSGTHDKVTIICKEHGKFQQIVNNHEGGAGCPGCAMINKIKKRRDSERDFIRKAKKTHGNLYDYSDVNYINSRQPVKIICKKHGPFMQRTSNHINRTGCPKCGIIKAYEKNKNILEENGGWSYTKWEGLGERSTYFDIYKVYIIKLDKELYKIGRTFKELKYRMREFPYSNIEILDVIVNEDPRVICNLERELLNLCKNYNKIPDKEFNGMYECFSSIDPIIPLLK